MKTNLTVAAFVAVALAVSTASCFAQDAKKPNIIIIWGDDIGQSNISAYSHGLMGYRTPNIDRVAHEGVMFTDYYAEQSCTAGRASFITGQCGLRTGNTTVGMPGATQSINPPMQSTPIATDEPPYETPR
jgi:arylsulfatase A-like enzyme